MLLLYAIFVLRGLRIAIVGRSPYPRLLAGGLSASSHFQKARLGAEEFRGELAAALEKLDTGALLRVLAGDGAGLRDYGRETGITMCGREPVSVMLATLKKAGLRTQARVLHYTTSGDVTGDWRSSVS